MGHSLVIFQPLREWRALPAARISDLASQVVLLQLALRLSFVCDSFDSNLTIWRIIIIKCVSPSPSAWECPIVILGNHTRAGLESKRAKQKSANAFRAGREAFLWILHTFFPSWSWDCAFSVCARVKTAESRAKQHRKHNFKLIPLVNRILN